MKLMKWLIAGGWVEWIVVGYRRAAGPRQLAKKKDKPTAQTN